MTYAQACEAARIVVQHFENRGWTFRNDVVGDAALMASVQPTTEAAANAMEEVITLYRLPDYDLRCCG